MPIFRVDVAADPHHPRVVDSRGTPVPAISDFLSYLEQCARSPYTVRAYARGLAHFATWLHGAGIDLDAVTRPIVGRYIGAFGRESIRNTSRIDQSQTTGGRQARTVNHRLSVLRRTSPSGSDRMMIAEMVHGANTRIRWPRRMRGSRSTG